MSEKNNKTKEEVKKSFKEGIEADLEPLKDEEKLEYLTGKDKTITDHIEAERKELDSLEASYEVEKQKQAEQIEHIRAKLYDKSAGQMLNELQTIAMPAQKRQLIDNIEKVKTNLLALVLDRKDLLLIKRQVEEKIKSDRDVEEAKKNFSMMLELFRKYQACKAFFDDFISQVGMSSNGWPLKVQEFWQSEGWSKDLMTVLLFLGDSHLKQGALPGLSFNSFIQAAEEVASHYNPNPLDLPKDSNRQTRVKWIGQPEYPDDSFEQTEVPGNPDQPALDRLAEIFNE